MEIDRDKLRTFVFESNLIEGIHGVRDAELEAHETFLRVAAPDVTDVEQLVGVLQPRAVLRRGMGMDVRVGRHVPPRGGPAISIRLSEILSHLKVIHPYEIHHEYETLHPFTDGNGRSGRALWLWQMMLKHHQPETFLHQWYYQSLQKGRSK